MPWTPQLEQSLINLKRLREITASYVKKSPKPTPGVFDLLTVVRMEGMLHQWERMPELIANILLCISILGLFWLKYTEKNRHSFWLRPDTGSIKELKSIQAADWQFTQNDEFKAMDKKNRRKKR